MIKIVGAKFHDGKIDAESAKKLKEGFSTKKGARFKKVMHLEKAGVEA